MNNSAFWNSGVTTSGVRQLVGRGTAMPRQLIVGLTLVLALFAFELFNFDTTRYALQSLLGDVRFAGLAWATILAIAFCAIDFAGLSRLFTPERGLNEPREVWYLTGAWLLGATMNAVMTWWAVSLTLLNHDLGNEVLSREQLLTIVPIFVAALVWLTRILFIGALTVAGERLLHPTTARLSGRKESQAPGKSPAARNGRTKSSSTGYSAPKSGPSDAVDITSPQNVNGGGSHRVKQRPPRPAMSTRPRRPSTRPYSRRS